MQPSSGNRSDERLAALEAAGSWRSSRRAQSKAERAADSFIHGLGLVFAALGSVFLLTASRPEENADFLALAVYALGLVAMLSCSALYNLSPPGRWQARFRRLDHAAIFVMIAGTYTPFAAIALGGFAGTSLLAVVWSGALLGAALKLVSPRRLDRFSTVAYLLLGWTIVGAFGPLLEVLPTGLLTLLVAGGLLYSVGVVFYRWRSLPFQNAVWHGLVLAAAICHFAAVVGVVRLD